MEIGKTNQKQYNKILDSIIVSKDAVLKREHEIKVLMWTEIFKIIGLTVGAGGIVYMIIEAIV